MYELLALSGILVFFIFSGSLLVFIWFNINMTTAMNTVSIGNRKMSGGLVWLNAIPVFNLIWPFFFNTALKNSYESEFKMIGIREQVNLQSGIVYPIIFLVAILLNFITSLLIIEGAFNYSTSLEIASILGIVNYVLLIPSSFIFQIVFWVKVNNLKNLLKNHMQNAYWSQNNIKQGLNYPNQVNVNIPQTNTPVNEPIKNKEVPEETVIDKLKKYHEMYNNGLLNQHDFDKIKKEILKNNK